ncbi:DsrE family protein, partial [Rhodoferax sp.]|uniref:DsrE family protein n=1 Tax=Rhodoferax sp. TaxID=50421 RepID=UPI0027743BDE|nr:DsrE family protein [Rhodoferax sp.]
LCCCAAVGCIHGFTHFFLKETPMYPRRLVLSVAMTTVLGCTLPWASAQTAPAARPHKVVFQVSDADPAKWSLALNNAKNVQTDLGKDQVAIEIVAYGPGIGMLRMESVAGARVTEAMAAGVSVVACENTMHNLKITRDDMLPKIGYVAAGVVQLMVRQKEGYAYIRP